MTIHEAGWPDTLKDEAVKKLLQTYMSHSNPAETDSPESFADLFTNDGVYVLGSKSAQGRSGIYCSSVPPATP